MNLAAETDRHRQRSPSDAESSSLGATILATLP